MVIRSTGLREKLREREIDVGDLLKEILRIDQQQKAADAQKTFRQRHIEREGRRERAAKKNREGRQREAVRTREKSTREKERLLEVMYNLFIKTQEEDKKNTEREARFKMIERKKAKVISCDIVKDILETMNEEIEESYEKKRCQLSS